VAQYPGRPEFEANADRARESAETLLAESLAAEAATERHSDNGHEGTRGPFLTLLERIRSMLGGIRGR
jgi:hypothetical protein